MSPRHAALVCRQALLATLLAHLAAGTLAGRLLQQAPALTLTPTSSTLPLALPAQSAPATEVEAGEACLSLNRQAGYTCSVSIDRLAQSFPRGSTELPTQQQIEDALAALRQGGLPAIGSVAAGNGATCAEDHP